eukprot:698124-Pelagomonas_calceolata.AAC.2
MFGNQGEADVSQKPARPPQAHGMALDGTALLSTLLLVQLLSPGLRSSLADNIELLLRMIPACHQN